MGKVEVSASTSASPMRVYELLLDSGVISGLRAVDGVPFERVDLLRPPSRFIADYFGRIELIELSDGGTLIRWRIVFRAGFARTRWLIRLGLLWATSRLAHRLAQFASARDYDTPPY